MVFDSTESDHGTATGFRGGVTGVDQFLGLHFDMESNFLRHATLGGRTVQHLGPAIKTTQ
jgi:hypothetical protein